jgi:hypothetical protein
MPWERKEKIRMTLQEARRWTNVLIGLGDGSVAEHTESTPDRRPQALMEETPDFRFPKRRHSHTAIALEDGSTISQDRTISKVKDNY